MESITSTVDVAAAAVSAKPRARAKKVAGKVANKDGVRAYMTAKGVRFVAQVRVKGRPAISKSFEDREEALKWKREQELGGERPTPAKITLPECFDLFIKHRAEIGSPVSYDIERQFTRMSKHPVLKDVRVDQVGRKTALAYCVARKNEGVVPSTVLGEFVRLNLAVRGCAKAFEWGKFNPLEDVREELFALKLIAESNKRTRRPSPQEMDALLAYFSTNTSRTRDGRVIPMVDLIKVAALNAFRRGELFQLRWSDLRADDSAIIVRNRKDASAVGDTDALVPLLPAALEIVLRQPRVEGAEPGSSDDIIFPFSANTVSKVFTKACVELKIEDLHFHDLRHEAISTIAHVLNNSTAAMMISGHKTERHFRRYVNSGAEEARRIAAQLAHVQVISATPANVTPLKVAA